MLRNLFTSVLALGMLFGVLVVPADAAKKVAKANTPTARQAATAAARRRHRHPHHKVVTTPPVFVPAGS